MGDHASRRRMVGRFFHVLFHLTSPGLPSCPFAQLRKRQAVFPGLRTKQQTRMSLDHRRQLRAFQSLFGHCDGIGVSRTQLFTSFAYRTKGRLAIACLQSRRRVDSFIARLGPCRRLPKKNEQETAEKRRRQEKLGFLARSETESNYMISVFFHVLEFSDFNLDFALLHSHSILFKNLRKTLKY